VLLALVLTFTLLPTAAWLKAAVAWASGLGHWGWAAFVVVYALLTTLAVPTSPLNLAAGLLFDALSGFLAAELAVTLAALASFLIARYAAREWVLRRVSCHPKYSNALHGLRRESWKMILMTRLNPLLPSFIANYCFGVTTVRFRTYLAASVMGNAPLCFLFAYLGSAGHVTFGAGKHRPTPAEWALYVVGLLATVALTWWATRYTARTMRDAEQAGAATSR
jgi:uncharacterized membrane protein YdjX (TVP38/TMEM64 family)